MDYFWQIVGFGFLALGLFGCSLVLAKQKHYIAGLVFGVLELLAGAVSCRVWMLALKVSGKSDWFLLGLLGYTPVALIFYAMMGAGILCVVLNFRGLKWNNIKI